MADKTITERLQPSLLDRLTDHEPNNLKESRSSRVIDVKRLREIISRDLGWLLNKNNQDSLISNEKYPHVTKSVVNYGVREVSGNFSTKRRAEQIRSSIHRAISVFEPRIKEGTLDVILREDENMSQTIIEFDIHADMWAQPLPMELYLRSQVDVITGELRIERQN